MQLKAWSYVCAEGITLRGWYSEPSGKPVVHFMHGNGFCGLTYEPMLNALATHFDLWISDIQGHGDSDSGERFYGWNESALRAIEAFKQQNPFGEVPCYAVGHSFGGVVSGLMVSHEPALFRALVMLDPVIFTPKIIWYKRLLNLFGLKNRLPMVQAALKRRTRWASAQEAADALRGRGIYKGWQEDAHQAFITHALKTLPDGAVELKCPTWLEAEIFASSPQQLWPSLERVKVPSLILYGDKSYPFVAEAALRLKSRNACVTVAKTAGGHCFMQEAPEQTAKQILGFLAAI